MTLLLACNPRQCLRLHPATGRNAIITNGTVSGGRGLQAGLFGRVYGEGNDVTVSLGHKVDPKWGHPVDVGGTVRRPAVAQG